MKYTLLVLCLLLSACSSSTVLRAGGYKFVHFNDPECIGASASGVVMAKVQGDEEEVIEANVAHKTGYCESITGQAISVGGKIYGQKQLRKGLEKSGDSNTVTGGMESPASVLEENPDLDF